MKLKTGSYNYANIGIHFSLDSAAKDNVEPTPIEKAKSQKSKGVKLFKSNSFQEAINAFTNSISMNPKDSDTFYLRAATYSKLKNKKDMVSDLKESARMGNLKAKEMLRSYNED